VYANAISTGIIQRNDDFLRRKRANLARKRADVESVVQVAASGVPAADGTPSNDASNGASDTAAEDAVAKVMCARSRVLGFRSTEHGATLSHSLLMQKLCGNAQKKVVANRLNVCSERWVS